ncbi:kinase-like domain-containing protein [Cladochytrium replicatum]|nr:kinase-like domain-containing protein [Cladochytrium replicatum]
MGAFQTVASDDDDGDVLPPPISSSSRQPPQSNAPQRFSLFKWLASFIAAMVDSLMRLMGRMAPQPDLSINDKRYQVLQPLGEGGFSFVYLVRRDGRLFALKRVRLQLPEQEERFASEVAAMKRIASPYVMAFEDSAVLKGRDGNPIEGLIVMPYYSGGTVQDLIEKTPAAEFIPMSKILQLTVDICKGLLAFHTQNPPLAFRDLKPANVIVADDGRAILMDLGSVAPARITVTSRREAVAIQDTAAETVTAPFRSPELFEPGSNSVIDERTDVWALGCTVYAMAYRSSPFDGTMTAAVSGKVLFPPKPGPYTAAFRSFVQSMLAVDLRARPTVDTVMKKAEALLAGGTSAPWTAHF